MSGREGLDLIAYGVEGLQLGSEVNSAGLAGVPALVKGSDTDGVPGSNGAVLRLVVKNKREHAVEVLGGIDAIFEVLEGEKLELHLLFLVFESESLYQRNDDLAIRGGLEVVGVLQALANKTVVVDLAIDGEDNAVIGIGEWLSSALCF